MPPRSTRSSGRAARLPAGAGGASASGSAQSAAVASSSSGAAPSSSSSSAPASASGVAGLNSLPQYGTDSGARAQLAGQSGQIRPASAHATSTSGAGFVFGAPFASSSGSAASSSSSSSSPAGFASLRAMSSVYSRIKLSLVTCSSCILFRFFEPTLHTLEVFSCISQDQLSGPVALTVAIFGLIG